MVNIFSSSDMSIFPEVLLDDIKSIKKIGTFNFRNKISIGDFEMNPLDVVAGTYNIYKLDDNLAIILDKKDYLKNSASTTEKRKKISGVLWKKYKFSVPVDSGTFGFYDTEKVFEINKLLNKQKDKLPYIDWSKVKSDAFIVGTNNIDNEYKSDGSPSRNIPNYDYGVISSSGTGDGIFDVYTTSDKSAAVILGGITMIKFYENNGLLDQMPGNLSVYRKYMKKTRKID